MRSLMPIYAIFVNVLKPMDEEFQIALKPEKPKEVAMGSEAG